MPVHTYTNWNSRPSDEIEQIEPFRKYFFICEGANTETFYFRRLIDLRKQLGIHPLIDIRLWEKTDEDRNLSFAKNLVAFAEKQKQNPENEFDYERDKMVIVFDGDIFEEKVQGYEELIIQIENTDIAGVTNPGFELFLLLHIEGSYEGRIHKFRDGTSLENAYQQSMQKRQESTERLLEKAMELAAEYEAMEAAADDPEFD